MSTTRPPRVTVTVPYQAAFLGTSVLRVLAEVGESWGLAVQIIPEGGFLRPYGRVRVTGDVDTVERWLWMAGVTSTASTGITPRRPPA